MKRPLLTLCFFAVAVYVVVRLSGGVPASGDWLIFAPERGGFSILVPGEMTQDQETIDLGTANMVFHNAQGEWQGVVYNVGWSDLPEMFLQVPPDELLRKFIYSMVSPERGIRNESRTSMLGAPCVEAVYENLGNDRVLTKQCIKDGRFYRMLVSVPSAVVENARPHYEKFLSTFQFVVPAAQ